MSLKLNSSGGGSVTLQEPVTASDFTLTLPSANGTVVIANASNNVAVTGDLNVSGATTLAGNPTVAGTVVMGSSFLRNRIINGAMVIDQRNSGAAVTINSGNYVYTVDRWAALGNVADGVYTVQRSTIAPSSFTNSLLATVTTADASIGASQFYIYKHPVEGFNVADLGWGTASAQTVTLSFWVRSSVTGTFSGSLTNSAYNRAYAFSYTINSTNTFEYKTITIAGDTSGTWLTDSSAGIVLYVDLGSGSGNKTTAGSWGSAGVVGATGSVNLIATTGATFYITGVQLEVGTVATPFERRLYGQELALCQRYCLVWRPQVNSGATSFPTVATGYATSSSAVNNIVQTPVALRTTPTLSYAGTITFAAGGASAAVSSIGTVYEASNSSFWFGTSHSGTPFTIGNGGILYCGNSTSNVFVASAEL